MTTARLRALRPLLLEAGDMARSLRATMTVEVKPDGSLVTNADADIEAYLRPHLLELEPGSTVWGEELGYDREGPGGLWLVDPIDGTTNYRYGWPLYAISVGFYQNGALRYGGAYLPDIDELYLVEAGQGAWKDDMRLTQVTPGIIGPTDIVSYPDPKYIPLPHLDVGGKTRIVGSVVVDGMFTASGRFRAMVGIREKLYDVAVCFLILRELGFELRYLDGARLHESDLLDDVKIESPWVALPPDR